MKTLLIIILVILLIRLLARIFLPMILKSFIERASRDIFNFQNHQQPSTTEGEIKIKPGESSKKSRLQEGEYVDFEEVK